MNRNSLNNDVPVTPQPHNPKLSQWLSVGHFKIEKFTRNYPDPSIHSETIIRLHHAGQFQEFEESALEEFLYKISSTSPVVKENCIY